MDEQFRKRLEEAAEKYIKIITPDDIPYYHKDVKQAFRAGAEHGYKEAIAQCIFYLRRDYAYNASMSVHDDAFLDEFEAEMLKLWEE